MRVCAQLQHGDAYDEISELRERGVPGVVARSLHRIVVMDAIDLDDQRAAVREINDEVEPEAPRTRLDRNLAPGLRQTCTPYERSDVDLGVRFSAGGRIEQGASDDGPVADSTAFLHGVEHRSRRRDPLLGDSQHQPGRRS